MNLLIKLLILGSQFVGKTSLLKRFNDTPINDYYMATIGIDYDSVIFNYKDCKHKVILWDTSGQDKFNFILDAYFKSVSGAIIMYEVTDQSSYNQAEKWIEKFKNKNNNNLPIIVLSNKIDLDKKRILFDNDLQLLKKKYNVNVLDISVKENINIDKILPIIFDDLLNKLDNNKIIPSKKNGIKIMNELETIIEEPELKTKQCCRIL